MSTVVCTATLTVVRPDVRVATPTSSGSSSGSQPKSGGLYHRAERRTTISVAVGDASPDFSTVSEIGWSSSPTLSCTRGSECTSAESSVTCSRGTCTSTMTLSDGSGLVPGGGGGGDGIAGISTGITPTVSAHWRPTPCSSVMSCSEIETHSGSCSATCSGAQCGEVGGRRSRDGRGAVKGR